MCYAKCYANVFFACAKCAIFLCYRICCLYCYNKLVQQNNPCQACRKDYDVASQVVGKSVTKQSMEEEHNAKTNSFALLVDPDASCD